MPTSPVQIQLALQGGGAKISTLIAAMEAIEDLEKDNIIKVTRIAGTSAGSIIGALYAAKIPVTTIKTHFNKIDINEVVSKPKKPIMLMRFFRGKAFCDVKPLKKVLVKLFEKSNKKVTYLKDLYIPTYVTATDIKNSKMKCYSEDDDIINALLDSCAIPFVFRAHKSGGDSVILDGGICENLPSDLLVDHIKMDGYIVGISFAKTPGNTPQGLLQFCIALFNTAIDNSMDRAKRSLGEAVHYIDTDITTFDFSRAMEFLDKADDKNSDYKIVKDETKRHLLSIIEGIENKGKDTKDTIVGDPWKVADTGDYWARSYTKLMHNIGKMHDIQAPLQKKKYLHCSLIVTGGRKDKGKDSFDADEVRAIGVYKSNSTVYSHHIYLSHAEHHTSLEKSDRTIRLLDSDKIIKTVPLPIFDQNEADKHKRGLLLCFDPVISVEDGAYEMTFVDTIQDLLEPLYANGRDELVMSTSQAENGLELVELVLHLPKDDARFNSVHMMAKENAEHPGRIMNKNELLKYHKNAPHKMKTLGWVGENIPGNIIFGVDVFL